jgi:hypothetical protein
MAHPFDEKQGRLTGEPSTDCRRRRQRHDQWPRGVFGFGKWSADLPVGTEDRWIWSPDVVRPQRQEAGHSRRDGFYRYPRVSPDGRHVVVTFSKDEVGMDLWQIDLARGVPTGPRSTGR